MSETFGASFPQIGQVPTPTPSIPAAMPAWGENAPTEAVTTNAKVLFKKYVSITGYIADKRNYLSKTINAKEAKKLYDEKYKELKAKSATDPSALKYKVVDEDKTTGKLTENGQVADLKDAFSMAAFKAILPEKYAELKEKGTYTIKMTEKSAAYYVITNKYAEVAAQANDDDRVRDSLGSKVSVISDSGAVAIIKPKDLCELLINVHVPLLNVNKITENGPVRVGSLTPVLKKKEKDGKVKQTLKTDLFRTDMTRVSTPGDLRLAYAINKNYKGDKVTPAEILNEKTFKEIFPAANLADLRTLKKLPKATGDESPSKQEEIPYEDQVQAWTTLGITKEMLDSLRSKKSQNKSTVTIAEIEAEFDKASAEWAKYKNAK